MCAVCLRNMKIEYYTKNVYGIDKMYVCNPEFASRLSGLLGTITINHEQMRSLSDLFGVEWDEVIAPKKA